MTRQSGFTLVELMTVVALTTVLAGAMAGLAQHAQRGVAETNGMARELQGFRAALDRLTADLREARAVEVGTDVVIRTRDGERRWSCTDGALVRRADGRPREMARSVRALRVEADGALWNVTLLVGRGSPLRTAVLPRTEGGR